MRPSFLLIVLAFLVTSPLLEAESLNTRRAIEKTNKELIPDAEKRITEATGAKISVQVDAASFGDDEKAWANMSVLCNRIVSACAETGNDQIGKDALAKAVQKIVIVKPAEAGKDSATLKDNVLTIQTTASDESLYHIAGIIKTALEKSI